MTKNNFDPNVIDDFGDEWQAYDQSSVDYDELGKTIYRFTSNYSHGMRM